jgi:hypothetical protein
MKLDHSVFPDQECPPRTLSTPEERADYLHRVSAQWDYGIVPERITFELFRQWKDVFDRYPMRHSAAYHSFRSLFGWEAVPGRLLRAGYEIDDLKEGRTDTCKGWI